MSDEVQAVSEVDAVAEAIRAEQVRIEDACVSIAKANGWCDEIERGLLALFPGGPSWPNPDNKWTSSVDGRTCKGEIIYDRDGFNRLGFNTDGYGRDGFNVNGWDRHGFNREGVDRQGVRRDDPARFKFNHAGHDAEGYDRDGNDRYGFRRDERPDTYDRFTFDRDGYDAEGFNASGFDRDGFDRGGYTRNGYDREGFTTEGRDRYGRNREGVTSDGRRYGADGQFRVADLDRWQREYLGSPGNGRPEDYGISLETEAQAAEAVTWWLARTADQRRTARAV